MVRDSAATPPPLTVNTNRSDAGCQSIVSTWAAPTVHARVNRIVCHVIRHSGVLHRPTRASTTFRTTGPALVSSTRRSSDTDAKTSPVRSPAPELLPSLKKWPNTWARAALYRPHPSATGSGGSADTAATVNAARSVVTSGLGGAARPGWFIRTPARALPGEKLAWNPNRLELVSA